jgi:hypothetical protein
LSVTTAVFTFDAEYEYADDNEQDMNGHRGIVMLNGFEIARTPSLEWNEDDARQAALEHLAERLKGLLA